MNTKEIKRKERRSQWAGRYSERNPHSTLADQPLEEGQEGGSSIDLSNESVGSRQKNGNSEHYWNPSDEHYYNPDQASTNGSVRSSGRWRYPANFDDAATESSRKKIKKKKDKKDRWARTEDAYSLSESAPPKKKKSKKKRSTNDTFDADTYSRTSGSTNEFPEDPEGGLYGTPRQSQRPQENERNDDDDIFAHQF